MDAFSLALSIGTMAFSKKYCFLLSACVGIFHFFMPLIGSFLGVSFIKYFHININFLSGIIFAYIAIQMLKEFFNEDKEDFKMNFISIIIFALGVSLDSFGIGFTMINAHDVLLRNILIFSIFSFIFTYLGLSLGKILNKLVGTYSILFGVLIMLLLSIINFVNFCAFN